MWRRRMRTQSEWNVEISGRSLSFLPSRAAARSLHFVGRLVGEGDGQNALGPDAVADQLGDAVGDDAGLAGARPGQHQQRPREGVTASCWAGLSLFIFASYQTRANHCPGRAQFFLPTPDLDLQVRMTYTSSSDWSKIRTYQTLTI